MSIDLKGVIAAAGKGARLKHNPSEASKVLMAIDDACLLERNIAIMEKELGIGHIAIIAGTHNAEQIRKVIFSQRRPDVKFDIVVNEHIEKGIAEGLLLAEKIIGTSPFCFMLSDELYLNSNHAFLPESLAANVFAVCCVKTNISPPEIKKNYSVTISNKKIVSLSEKPAFICNDHLGCGTFLFRHEIFSFIRQSAHNPKTGVKEISDALNLAISAEKQVLPFYLTGAYVNVNTMDDLSRAKYLVREAQLHKKKISVIIPALNEATSIGFVIDDFMGQANEIIVVDNNSRDKTRVIAEQKGAVVYTTILKGYGDALRYGMKKATGDILILTEADGSFRAKDMGKIIEYLKDADIVLGTRTTKQLIAKGAAMGFFLRFGNGLVAKFIEVLWWRYNAPRLTDVGCTYRGIWRTTYNRLEGRLIADGPDFSPEMIIESIINYMRIIEIPVSYYSRIGGKSKHSKGLFGIIKTAVTMLKLIIKKRFS